MNGSLSTHIPLQPLSVKQILCDEISVTTKISICNVIRLEIVMLIDNGYTNGMIDMF